MLITYKAILRGNQLEWTESVPEHLEREVAVHVTILDEPVPPAKLEQGRRMAAALEQLAAMNALSEITDPVAWEREMRQDRVLVGRES
jgi:hypothetical protein